MQISKDDQAPPDLSWVQFCTLMTTLGHGIVVAEQNCDILYVNECAQRFWRRDSGQLIGQNWTILDLPLHADATNPVPYTHVCPDGTLSSADVCFEPLTFQGRACRMAVLRGTDKECQPCVETRFRDLTGAALDWFWETNAQHHLIFLSNRIAAILGINPLAALGRSFAEIGLQCRPDQDTQHQADMTARIAFHDRIFQFSASTDGDVHTLSISGTPIFDALGNFTGYRGVAMDISREIAAEGRAREIQQIMEESMASLVDGVVVFDVKGQVVTCNRAYLKVLGFKDLSEILGKTLEDILRHFRSRFDLQGRSFEDWLAERLAQHRQATGQPFIMRLTNGSWILSRECRLGSGGVAGVRTDITEIKHREHELEMLKTRYQLILDSAGEGIIGLDEDGIVSFANQTAHGLLRYEPGQLIGHSFISSVQICDDHQETVLSVYTDGVAQHVTNQSFRRIDGTIMPVDFFAAPVLQDHRISGAVVVFQDATLRVQYETAMATIQQDLERLVAERTQQLSREVEIRSRTESALRESRARMKGITDCLLEGVLVVNGGGDIMFANPAARSMLCPGCDDEMEGLPMDQFLYLGQETPTYFNQSPWRKVIKQQQGARNDDAQFTTADGRVLTVAYACSPLVVEGGTAAAVILFRDIKELKDAQWDAMQASRLASVGQLAAGIAHEINTPTQYIGDNLRFLQDSFQSIKKLLDGLVPLLDQDIPSLSSVKACFQDEDLPYLIDEIPAALAQSQEGVDQVRRIVLSMKEFSHPGTSHKVVADINRAVESTLTVCRNTWKQVATVETRFAPDLPQILCFPSELNQVFLNLIINATHAIEASGKGGLGVITVSTQVSGEWLEVHIQDTGTGIPAAIRDRIFDPFFTTKAVGKGTGQGLAISRDVVLNKHGGRLDFETTEGVGTTFIVRLPVLSTEDVEHPQ